MIQGALWMAGLYLLAAVSVHLVFKRVMPAGRGLHYILVTKDNQQQIEGVLRALIFRHWLQGRTVRITVVDEGSRDDTMPIVARLARDREESVRCASDDTAGITSLAPDEEVIRICMNQLEDARKIPMYP